MQLHHKHLYAECTLHAFSSNAYYEKMIKPLNIMNLTYFVFYQVVIKFCSICYNKKYNLISCQHKAKDYLQHQIVLTREMLGLSHTTQCIIFGNITYTWKVNNSSHAWKPIRIRYRTTFYYLRKKLPNIPLVSSKTVSWHQILFKLSDCHKVHNSHLVSSSLSILIYSC